MTVHDMGRKKKHEEHANHERWLVSYADFITLLFAFFVVLFASSQVDRSKSKKMALAIESAFDRFSIFKEQSGDSIEADERGGSGGNAKKFREYLLVDESGKAIILPAELIKDPLTMQPPKSDPDLDAHTGFIGHQEAAMSRSLKNLMDLVEKKKLNGKVMIVKDDRGIIISLREAILFDEDSTEIKPEAKDALEYVGKILETLPNQIRVEGHTDSGKTKEDKVNNWKVSTDRAAAVVQWLLKEFRIKASRLVAVGYGEYRPIGRNDTAENRQQNRRVDIIILSKKAAEHEAPLNEELENQDREKREKLREGPAHPFPSTFQESR